jgi:hypothetical protein
MVFSIIYPISKPLLPKQFGSCEIKEQNSVKEYYFVFAEAVKR